MLFKIARVIPLDLATMAKAEPGEDERSGERMKLEGIMTEIAQKLSDDKLRRLIDNGRVLARGT